MAVGEFLPLFATDELLLVSANILDASGFEVEKLIAFGVEQRLEDGGGSGRNREQIRLALVLQFDVVKLIKINTKK